MKKPISFRIQIPFFYNKTNAEFRLDQYERFDEMVVRQTALHLADNLWGKYPFQPVLDFVNEHFPETENPNIVELGCGVGRLIGTLALKHPTGNFWGLDFSYQMLKRAHEFWIESKIIPLNLSNRGFAPINLKGHALQNVQFGLARAEDLPFEKETKDAVLSSFLLDRLEEPEEGLKEMFRVLKSGGKLILVSPLNFQKKKDWEKFYPPERLSKVLENVGFKILKKQEDLILEEPMDFRFNVIKWKAVGIAAIK